jgi:hypothetical protein
MAGSGKTIGVKTMRVFASAAMGIWLLFPQVSIADNHEIDLDLLTPHGSEIDENHVDEALVGTWIMVNGQVENAGRILPMRGRGRRLSILASGSFQEDYNSEASSAPTPGLEAGQRFGDGIDAFSPKDSCRMRGEGLSVGHMTHYEEVNLDITPPLVDATTMRVVLNKAASIPFKVRCHDSSQVRGNMVTPPLGYGYARTGGGGPYVEYYYKLHPLFDADGDLVNQWHGLEIWSAPSPAPVVARYYFVRGL